MVGGGSRCGVSAQVGGKKGVKLDMEKKTALYEKAKKYQIKGRSKMTKGELVQAIRNKQQEIGNAISRRTKK
jgi:hypothetical protein